jgi:hypothetical protein
MLALGARVDTSIAAGGCSRAANGQIACPIRTGLNWVKATDYSTGLGHASGDSDVDVISLLHSCRSVTLYYVFGFQGAYHDLPPVTVPVGQAAVTNGGPLKVMSSSALTAEIRALLHRFYPQPAAAALSYSLPYPTSYWYVYVAHTEAEGLSIHGVRCNQ